MADKKANIFKRTGKKFGEVIAELKRVVWTTKEKLAKTSAVVLLVIVFFAVYLTLIGQGGRWVLDKIGFYDTVETSATESSASDTVASESATASETAASAESVTESVVNESSEG